MNRNHYSDLEHSKKLKELGMPQFERRRDGAVWSREIGTDSYSLVSCRDHKNQDLHSRLRSFVSHEHIENDCFSAFSLVEFMDIVKSDGKFDLTVPESDTVALVDKTSGKEVFRTFGPVPNAAAAALAWLLENRLVEFGTR